MDQPPLRLQESSYPRRGHHVSCCEKFLNAFSKQGFRMVKMSCKDHDGYAAVSELITHIVGRILEGLMPESMLISMNFLALHRAATI
ncbi:hypothetical protein S245_020800 [Arachis hypogaea]